MKEKIIKNYDDKNKYRDAVRETSSIFSKIGLI